MPRGGFRRIQHAEVKIQKSRILSVEKLSAKKMSLSRRGIVREKTLIPGLVDPHTHLVFAGNRAEEWGKRLAGASYEEIARAGGGIKKTVRETRMATEDDLLALAQKWLSVCRSYGVTSLEIKTGYGLSLESELKILKVIRKLAVTHKMSLVSTLMPAHAVPPEFSNAKAYVNYLVSIVLPQLAPWAEFQDVFCERGYFSEQESLAVLQAGKRWGLKPKVHAHEFARSGGVTVAVKAKAVSAEHLMVMNDADITALKKAGVIPVILPCTSFFLGAKRFAPARRFLDRGLKVAIGSDFNPGTNPSPNFPLCGTMAAVHQGLTLEEALTAQTWHAALALDRRDRGCIVPGMRADLVALNTESFEEMYYHYGVSHVASVYWAGA
jgi:imidazolonepropionase